MTITTLYKYQQKNGTIVVSPIEPSCSYETRYRLIADEGKALTQDGENLYSVIDVASIDGWYEVDEPVEPEPESVEPESDVVEPESVEPESDVVEPEHIEETV